MRLKLSKWDVLFIGIIGVALFVLLFSLIVWPFLHPQVSATPTNYLIQNENTFPGTSSWQIPSDKGALTQIQAYTSTTSVSPGEKLTFYVSTQTEGMIYSISIYRLGWYGGLGGRIMS